MPQAHPQNSNSKLQKLDSDSLLNSHFISRFSIRKSSRQSLPLSRKNLVQQSIASPSTKPNQLLCCAMELERRKRKPLSDLTNITRRRRLTKPSSNQTLKPKPSNPSETTTGFNNAEFTVVESEPSTPAPSKIPSFSVDAYLESSKITMLYRRRQTGTRTQDKEKAVFVAPEKALYKGKAILVVPEKTTDKGKAVLAVPEKAKDKGKAVSVVPFSCPPPRLRDIGDDELYKQQGDRDNINKEKKIANLLKTCPVPGAKSKRPHLSELEEQDFIDKQRAYFKEIDAFELPVEEVSDSELD